MDQGDLFFRNLNREVSAGHHDAARGFDDCVDIRDGLLGLYLGDDCSGTFAIHEDLAEFQDVFAGTDKGERDEVDSHLHSERDVFQVFWGNRGNGEIGVGDVHSASGTDVSADDDFCGDGVFSYGGHFEIDLAVVEFDVHARLHFFDNLRIVDEDPSLVAVDADRREDKGRSVFEGHASIGEFSDANLEPGEVEEDCDRHLEPLCYFADEFDVGFVLVVCAVRTVDARDIHARFDHVSKGLFVRRRRSDRRNDLGFA